MKPIKTYFLKNNVNNLIKIGKSNDVERRIKEIVGQCSFVQLYVFHSVEGDHESYFHRLYADSRKSGEWFDLPNLTIDTIEAEYLNSISIKKLDDSDTTKFFINPNGVNYELMKSVYFFTFSTSIISMYGDCGSKIISTIRDIEHKINSIKIYSGSNWVEIFENKDNRGVILGTIDCETEVIVNCDEKNYHYKIYYEE